MNVKTCMSKDVRITAPNQSIREAARMMKEIDAGFLPVGEKDRLVGMITDRDIAVRAVAEGKGPDTSVRDIMTQEVHYCFEDEDLETVADHQMSELKVRRLPVLNRDKRLVGIISLSDICRTGDYNELSAATLSSVSTPGGQHMQR